MASLMSPHSFFPRSLRYPTPSFPLPEMLLSSLKLNCRWILLTQEHREQHLLSNPPKTLPFFFASLPVLATLPHFLTVTDLLTCIYQYISCLPIVSVPPNSPLLSGFFFQSINCSSPSSSPPTQSLSAGFACPLPSKNLNLHSLYIRLKNSSFCPLMIQRHSCRDHTIPFKANSLRQKNQLSRLLSFPPGLRVASKRVYLRAEKCLIFISQCLHSMGFSYFLPQPHPPNRASLPEKSLLVFCESC